ncbi:hypothetical protein MBLNU13_g08380t2 [Cladosporium sp. NU13]
MRFPAVLSRLLAFAIFLHFISAAVVAPLLKHQIEELARSEDDAEPLLNRRQSPANSSGGYTVVTGIQGTGTQPRLEIRQLEKNPDHWNIYLLGMNRFMRSNQSEKLSYYQVAGIHGRPYVPWDGVGPAPGVDHPGYCAHLSQLFLPWHRPYLALYEQTLYSHIVAAVNEFPAGATRNRYAQAALSWRHPYWDWAAQPPDGTSVMPSSMTTPTVNVIMPNGTTEIPNPLYAYRFHPVSMGDFYYEPWGYWNTSLRAPNTNGANAFSQDSAIGPILDNSRISFRDRLYNLFTFYGNYSEFSTESYNFGGEFKNADSLESIHDVIHGATGSGGHMTYLDYSAYDPIFWLHHMMVDRAFALWQAVYPDSYVEPNLAWQGSYTIPERARIDMDTPLDPFHRNAKGDKWTARSARSTKTFGYTYPELQNNASVSAVKAAINKLYGSNTGGDNLLSKRFFDFDAPEPESGLSERDTAANNGPPKRREYIANIVSDKFSCNGSYAVYVFLGNFDSSDPKCWPTQPNLVGTHAVFSMIPQDINDDAQKAKRDAMSGIKVTGTIPLNSALLERFKAGEMRSRQPGSVEEYMTNNLQYRVAKFDGTEIPLADVPNLSVSVVGADVTPATKDDQFPKWANFQALRRVTDGIGARCT